MAAADNSDDIATKVIKLNDGVEFPVLGFGTFQMTPEQATSAVVEALNVGYRHIDTAQAYHNEEAIGKVLAESNIERRDIFITTKFWPGGIFNQPESTASSLRKMMASSLKKLQLECIDLVLIHGPFAKENRVDVYRELQKCKEEGMCRSVGVSNYGKHHIEELINAGLPLPSVNQIEIHPLNLQADLVAYCEEKNIALTAYASLAPLSDWRSGDRFAGSKNDDDHTKEVLNALTKTYGKSQAQICLRWAVQKGYAILPKSNTPSRIKANFDLNFTMSEEDMAQLDSNNKDRFVSWNDNFNPTSVE